MLESLAAALQILNGGLIVRHGELTSMVRGVRAEFERLKATLQVRPRWGLSMAPQVVDLLQAQLLSKRDHSQYACEDGPCEWLGQLELVLEGWHELSQEEQEEAVEDATADMEDHRQTIEYISEAMDELLQEERQNQAYDNMRLEKVAQQRLHASFDNR
jgi:hypothetical protein